MARVVKLNKKVEEVTWEEALKHFLFFKKAQGLTEATVKDYRSRITSFFKRYNCWQDEMATKNSILEYMSEEVAPSTYNLRLVYLRAFFNWCIDENYMMFANPLKGFKRRKADARIVDISEADLKKLLAAPDQTTFVGLRDYAFILLTLDTGIRPSEARSLRPNDFNFNTLIVHIRAEEAKTRTQRSLPLLPITAKAIRKLINVRHPEWEENGTVFCTFEGNHMDRQDWSRRMNYYSKKIEVNILPYDLRHAFALTWMRNGGHAFGLQSVLGHSDLQMTKRYVHMTSQDLREQHSRHSPLNSLTKGKIHRKKNL